MSIINTLVKIVDPMRAREEGSTFVSGDHLICPRQGGRIIHT